MSTKTIATKVDEDSKLYREFSDHAEDYGSNSEALRVALRRGMGDETGQLDRTAEAVERITWGVLSVGLAGLALGSSTLAGSAATTAAVLFVGVGVYRWRSR
jgi:Arc/MetJ-type ribon-helix-helix transcriptional regulator